MKKKFHFFIIICKNFDVTDFAGLVVEPIINGVGGTRYYVDFTQKNYAKLDNIPIPNGASVKFRYSVFGTNLYSAM